MSFNPDPSWTKDAVYPDITELVCPICKHIFDNVAEIASCYKSISYYEARHVPPIIYGTCGNIDCDRVDQDFEIHLRLVVSVTKIIQKPVMGS